MEPINTKEIIKIVRVISLTLLTYDAANHLAEQKNKHI